MSESEPDLKLVIENHIKELLFSPPSQNPPGAPIGSAEMKLNITPFLCDSSPLPSAEDQMAKCESLNALSPKDLLQLTCSSSQLIDLSVLNDFAAKHVGSSVDMSNENVVLPHPDLENSFFHGEHISEEQLAAYAHVDKPPGFRNVRKGSQSSEKNQNSIKKADSTKQKVESKKSKKRAKKRKQEAESKQSVSPDESLKSTPTENSPQHELAPKEKTKSSSKKKSVVKKTEILLLDEEIFKNQLPEEALIYSLFTYKGLHKFSCSLCGFDANSENAINEHVASSRHRHAVEAAEEDKILPYLPKPLTSQAIAITQFLKRWHSKVGLEEKDIIVRENLCLRIQEFVESQVPGCSVEMIGSSVTGIGLKESSADFLFKVESEKNVPSSLKLLYQTLKLEPCFINVESEFKKKSPGVVFTDLKTNIVCKISYERGLGLSEKFAKLISIYTALDDRVSTLGACFRYWARICGIDNKDNGTLPGYSYSILLIYFLQQIQPPVLPVLHELKEYSNADFTEEYLKKKKWLSKNEDSLGELWLKLFHFYSFTYELGNHVVCIRHAKKMKCSDKHWSTKFYAIEDPFVRRNIAHVIPSYQISEYIQLCFIRTYQYFAYPLLENGRAKLKKLKNFDSGLLECFYTSDVPADDDIDESTASDTEENDVDEFEDQDPDLQVLDVLNVISQLSLDEEQEGKEERKPDKPESTKKEASKEKSVKTDARKNLQNFCSWDVGSQDPSPHSYAYKMDGQIFKKKELPYTCRTCKSSGHTKKNCPKDELPLCIPLPDMPPKFMKIINKTLYFIKDSFCVSEEDREFIRKIMKQIEWHIRKEFPKARLSMFGSFCNGFGFRDRSDMDFCLTFKGMESGKELESAEVIEKIAKQLLLFPKLENIIPVTSAKVPIVKFSCTESGLEGDISLYNTLALVNTQMLHAYCKIDDKVQLLGFALKYFAKACGICDASRGSLSSYAYILMVIFFLQQRDPPVIPVLQELYKGEKPSEMIDGWNVWYFKDTKTLYEVWPHRHRNKESIGQLWLALLHFYAYEFDWKEYVISIRQKALLTRFDKLWITNQLAIEDPFDLSHNLGAGLSHKMNTYILKTFIKGRERFGKAPPDLNAIFRQELGYLFNATFLTSGMPPPHDRGCRICGKIGHLAKSCPKGKPCSLCKKIGHLAKDCPKKSETKSKKISDLNAQNKNSSLRSNNQSGIQPHSPKPQVVESRKSSTKAPGPMDRPQYERDRARQLNQLGVPGHRLPPPGFPKFGAVPPGFRPLSVRPNSFSMNGPRFPGGPPPPHGYQLLQDQAQSPPNHHGSSPPKNFQRGGKFHNLNENGPRMPEPFVHRQDPRRWQMPQRPQKFASPGQARRYGEADGFMSGHQDSSWHFAGGQKSGPSERERAGWYQP